MTVLTRLLVRLLQLPVHLYRLTLSPFLGRNCRFEPTCSAYALEALERHGPVRGGWLTLRRLSRCHPITWLGGSHGFDPVPARHVTHLHSPHSATSCDNRRAPHLHSDHRPKASS